MADIALPQAKPSFSKDGMDFFEKARVDYTNGFFISSGIVQNNPTGDDHYLMFSGKNVSVIYMRSDEALAAIMCLSAALVKAASSL